MPAIHYQEAGQGHPVVFLHGFCDTHELWSDFTPSLARACRTIVADLPGFGKSPGLPQPFSIDEVADVVADWLRGLNLGPVLMVGHSLGGYVALALLERHSDLLSGMVLLHSTAYPDTPERKEVRNKVIAFVQEHGVEPFVETFVPGLFADKNHPAIETTRHRCLQTSSTTLIGYALAMRERPDRSGLLFGASIPVLIIGGAKDALVPIESLKKQVSGASNLALMELPESGHMGMFEAKNQTLEGLFGQLNLIWPVAGT